MKIYAESWIFMLFLRNKQENLNFWAQHGKRIHAMTEISSFGFVNSNYVRYKGNEMHGNFRSFTGHYEGEQ